MTNYGTWTDDAEGSGSGCLVSVGGKVGSLDSLVGWLGPAAYLPFIWVDAEIRSRIGRTALVLRVVPNDVMSAKQLAAALHISKSGVYNLLNSPDFPTLRIGGRKLVMKQDLLVWLKQHTSGQDET